MTDLDRIQYTIARSTNINDLKRAVKIAVKKLDFAHQTETKKCEPEEPCFFCNAISLIYREVGREEKNSHDADKCL